MTSYSVVSSRNSMLGEGPVWDAGSGALYAVDAVESLLFKYESGSPEVVWQLPFRPGSFALRTGTRGLIMAHRDGVATLTPGNPDYASIKVPDIDFRKEQLNDGKCDRLGRFWFGSMDREIRSPIGGLFCVSPELKVKRVDNGIVLSNGIAWSPDDRTMYFCDSRRQIFAYDYEIGTGTPANRRVFKDFRDRPGVPDGCTVDAAGGLWVAEVGAGRVVRFSADGTETDRITTPFSKPTSVMFGGPSLNPLFITSMRQGISDPDLQTQVHAGATIAVECRVRGISEPRFAG